MSVIGRGSEFHMLKVQSFARLACQMCNGCMSMVVLTGLELSGWSAHATEAVRVDNVAIQ